MTHSKPKSPLFPRRHRLINGLLSTLMLASMPLFAEPQGASVISGDVNIQQQSNNTVIQQLSDQAIINWQNFDIGAQELVTFLQPDANAIALNRITDGNPTEILGQLSANGRLFILNPNGIVFGSSAQLDISALLATTLQISDDDFLNQHFIFQNGNNPSASIINRGEIQISEGGFAFLVAPSVSNEGLIVARLGQISLAAGNQLSIDFRGNDLISFAISGDITAANGASLSALVHNSGTLQANGGQVLLQGSAIGDAFTSVVNNSGVIQAQSLQNQQGKIILSGGINAGVVNNSGSLNASALESNSNAGEVLLSGYFTGNDGLISAQGSGLGNGGVVQINSTQQTLTTDNSQIEINGGNQGHAGQALLYSENHTQFSGVVNARGGSEQGDGGFIEVSSPGQVTLSGQVNASAPQGTNGMLLIDPDNIEINNDGSNFIPALGQFNDNPAGTSFISASSLNTLQANVLLQANNDITINNNINLGTANASLTLQAGHSLFINANISTNNGIINLTANDSTALAPQTPSTDPAQIWMEFDTTLNAGSADINLNIDPNGRSSVGHILPEILTTTGQVNLTATGDIVSYGTTRITADTATLMAGGSIGPIAPILNVSALNIDSEGTTVLPAGTPINNIHTINPTPSANSLATGDPIVEGNASSTVEDVAANATDESDEGKEADDNKEDRDNETTKTDNAEPKYEIKAIPLNTRIRQSYLKNITHLLQAANNNTDISQQQGLLQQARSSIEEMKNLELQTYLNIDLDNAKTALWNIVDPHTAVLYPVILEKELVLLLSIGGQMSQIAVPVSKTQLDKVVLQFRQHLQTRSNNLFLNEAQQLYAWLIAPLKQQLKHEGIRTLVFATDGSLRMIPIAALHDGKRFLIEQFALASTPGLSLTAPASEQRQLKALVMGLSEAVQGYSTLPNIINEVDAVQQLLNGSNQQAKQPLLNSTFNKQNIQQRLAEQPYNVLHFATHAQFGGTLDDSYLLTHKEKINTHDLKGFINADSQQPLELLTLSACQTALGNEQAALGFAGLAIQTGARTVLASLWFVDDEATSKLMPIFYHQLTNPNISKAQALQTAQQKLIQKDRFWHPAYWAAFTLIGNWL